MAPRSGNPTRRRGGPFPNSPQRWRTAALVAAICAAAPVGADGERRKFLVLHDSHSGLPANMAITAGMTAVFDEALPEGYDVYAEYRDGERFTGAEQDRRFAEEIVAKYQDLPLDAVITMGPGALVFAAETVASFASGGPVVFGAVTQEQSERLDLPATFTGVVADFDLSGTLRLARALQPEAGRVVVLSGSAAFDRQWDANARETLAGVDDIRVDHVSGLTVEGFERFAADVDANTILIFLTIFEDAAGERFLPRDAAARIAARASAPVYGVYSSYVGHGVVGGVFSSFETIGAAAARLALAALEGPVSAARVVSAPVSAVVDWRQIERFGLDASRLPPGTVTQFREVGAWERYRLQILVALAVILAQTATIAALAVQGRRRRKAEAAVAAGRLELAHLSRVAQIGELSGALAHELNQPLAAILANAEAGERLMAQTPPDLAEVRAILEDIVEDDRRAAAVVGDLRQLIAKRAPDLVELDVNDVVTATLRLARNEMRMRGVSVETRLDRGRLRVRGNKAQLQQVLINLMMNAADAMAGLQAEERRMIIETSRRADGWRELAVRDVGSGVAPEIRDGLFRPFRTTKPNGLGLGLSICRTIAETHGGTLDFDVAVTSGARVVLALPAP
jgi:signal transduction histidine kinase